MKILKIQDFGPIKQIELDLKRINVFIGPQSAGKSCILKTLCHCSWAEKRLLVTRRTDLFTEDNFFFEQLLAFHKLEGFAKPTTRIEYKTNYVTIVYDNATKSFDCSYERSVSSFRRCKLSYVPAERNIVSAFSDPMTLGLKKNNVYSYIQDWRKARSMFAKGDMRILDVAAAYHYDEMADEDQIHMNDGSKIMLSNASSGLQSIVPLMVGVQYLTSGKYDNETSDSNRILENEFFINRLYKNRAARMVNKSNPIAVNISGKPYYFDTQEKADNFKRIYRNHTEYRFSDLYIEEPEENIFPRTQRILLYDLLSRLGKEHHLTIATHSPYMLYTLNNCILAYLVSKEAPKDILKGVPPINPKDVGVWQIEDGAIVSEVDNVNDSIQDERGLIRKNFFDGVMREIMNDFTNMLSFLE